MAEYPSTAAMKSAVELEIEKCLGIVTTQSIGVLIQKAIDAANGWHPIETAPKDGTDILACDARVIGWTLVVAYDEDDETNCWMTADGPSYHRDMFTHWMPLPAPPVIQGENQQ